MRLPFPRACRGKGPRRKSGVKSRCDTGECQRHAQLKENPGLGTLPGTCGSNEPGKVLSYTPLCRWLLWFCLALFCLAFLGECFCPNRFLFGPQAAKGREQSSPAAAGSLCLNEQSSPAPPARSNGPLMHTYACIRQGREQTVREREENEPRGIKSIARKLWGGPG